MSADATSASTPAYQDVKCPANGEPRDAAVLLSICIQPIVNSLRWLRDRLEELSGSFLPLGGLLPLTLSVASSTFTLNGHGLNNGDPVRLWVVGGSVPAPLATATTYYVVNTATNTFQVSATSGGGAISLSTLGSGAIYAAKMTSTTLAQLVGAVASMFPVSGSTYARPVAGMPSWTGGASGAGPTWQSNDLGGTGAQGVSWTNFIAGGALAFPIGPGDVPNGATLNSVAMQFVGAIGHSTNYPPANMPTLIITRVDNAGNGVTLGSLQDATATATAYEVSHSLAVTGINATIDRSQYSYYAVLVAEYGTHSIANQAYGTVAWRPVCTWTGTVAPGF